MPERGEFGGPAFGGGGGGGGRQDSDAGPSASGGGIGIASPSPHLGEDDYTSPSPHAEDASPSPGNFVEAIAAETADEDGPATFVDHVKSIVGGLFDTAEEVEDAVGEAAESFEEVLDVAFDASLGERVIGAFISATVGLPAGLAYGVYKAAGRLRDAYGSKEAPESPGTSPSPPGTGTGTSPSPPGTGTGTSTGTPGTVAEGVPIGAPPSGGEGGSRTGGVPAPGGEGGSRTGAPRTAEERLADQLADVPDQEREAVMALANYEGPVYRQVHELMRGVGESEFTLEQVELLMSEPPLPDLTPFGVEEEPETSLPVEPETPLPAEAPA